MIKKGVFRCYKNSKGPKTAPLYTHTHTHTHVLLKDWGKRGGFTLAETLVVIFIIGTIAALSLPPLIESAQERQMVTGLLKFNSVLQQAVDMWKTDIGCYSDAYTCLAGQNLRDDQISNFNQIGKFMKIVKTTTSSPNTVDWLPDDTLDYYGNSESLSYGKVAHVGCRNGVFLLQDGTTFSIDVDPDGFNITVDVNGKKPPNRMGKDTFNFTIGKWRGKDIYPFYYWGGNNQTGLCHGDGCNADNVDPTKYGGASLPTYVILHHKLPDFGALSKTVSGFKP